MFMIAESYATPLLFTFKEVTLPESFTILRVLDVLFALLAATIDGTVNVSSCLKDVPV